ncbi:MAG: hypothetical protein ACREP8_05745 [Candidatus Binatia bacterium]
MSISLRRIFAVPILIAALAPAGCSTMKPMVSEWSNPAYASSSFKRIMVGGVDGQTSIRRNFEDEFVTQLRAAGVDALASYRYIPEDQKIDEAQLKRAAQKARADAAILARSVSVEQKTDYGPGYYPSPAFGIFGPHFGVSWSGPYGAPRVHRYDVYTSEATLYDVTKNELVWTGTVQTSQPDNVNAAIKSYVEAVVKALKEKNLVGVKK